MDYLPRVPGPFADWGEVQRVADGDDLVLGADRCPASQGRPVNSPPDVSRRGDLAHHRWVSSTGPPTRPGVPLKDRPLGDDEPTPSQASAKGARRRHCFVTLDEGETEGLDGME